MSDTQPPSRTRPARVTFKVDEPDPYWQQVGLELGLCNATTTSGGWDVYALDKRYEKADELIDKWRVIFDAKRALVEMRYPCQHEVRERVEKAATLAVGSARNSMPGRSPHEQKRHEDALRLRASYEHDLREKGYDLDNGLALSSTRRRRADTDYRDLDALIEAVQRRVGKHGEGVKPTARALGKYPNTIRRWVDKLDA